MKKYTVIAIALMVLSNPAWANQVHIAQTAGTTNDVTAVQSSGVNNFIDINQTASVESNRAEVRQATGGGYGYHAEITQQAGTYNYALVKQITPGGPGIVKIDQTATGGHNTATVDYRTGWFYDTNVELTQTGSLYNDAHVELSGAVSNGRVSVNQTTLDGHNKIDIITQHSTRVVKALYDGSISTASNPALPAVQTSVSGNNELKVRGQNVKIGLYQEAEGNNFADIAQWGNYNTLGIYQTNTSGFNSVTAIQNGNSSATVIQSTTSGNGIISVSQF